MCGIVGIWRYDSEPARESELRAMMHAIAHRGPDASGVWCQGPLGLGHVRLSILDLSARGNQPFVSHDGQGILVYNGEVYNFAELRTRLEAEGAVFRSTTDTEVVLEALHRWGPEQAIPEFNGMFAFAYYDLRTNELWLARDRLGIKPLYVAKTAKAFVFGSEMKALLSHPDVPAEPDMHSLTAQIYCMRIEGRWTPFKGIEALLPGSIVRIAATHSHETIYFDAFRDVNVGSIISNASQSPDVWPPRFEKLLGNSVKLHLCSDAPLAVMCSGGVDSSLVTAVAHGYKRDLVAYVGDVEGTVVERERALAVGKQLGVEIRVVEISRQSLLRDWPLSIWYNDQPSFHTHDAAFLSVSRAVAQDGFKVLLTGEGADELFGGYEWQALVYKMWRRRRWHLAMLPSFRPLTALARLLAHIAPLDFDSMAKRPFSYRSANGNGGVNQFSEGHELQNAIVFGELRALRRERGFEALAAIPLLEDRAFLANCLDDLYGYLQSLLQRNDRMGMAMSIESRFPFLENQLIDFACHLPRIAKLNRGTSKWVVKKAAEKRLSRTIVHAEKIGFFVPDSHWQPGIEMLPNGVLSELFKWSSQTQSTLIERIRSAPRLVYSLVSVELWARMFLRGQSAEELGDRLAFMPRAATPRLPKREPRILHPVS